MNDPQPHPTTAPTPDDSEPSHHLPGPLGRRGDGLPIAAAPLVPTAVTAFNRLTVEGGAVAVAELAGTVTEPVRRRRRRRPARSALD